MDLIQLPAVIITQRIIRPNFSFYYPVVTGLNNFYVQQKINRDIVNLVNGLILETGYYQNPGTEVSGYFEIKTNERGILSLSIAVYFFSGGAHGLTIIKSLTFDVHTGKTYQLSELFKPGSNYVKVISDIVAQQIKERDIPLLDEFKGIKPNQDYYIADKSLVIYFQLYEITPYAAGFQYFPISVYELQDILAPNEPLDKMLGSF